MPHRHSRRSFLAMSAGALATAAFYRPGLVRAQSPNGMLRIAHVGLGGMGGSDMGSLMSHSKVKYIAVCDVDSNNAANAAARAEGIQKFTDYRQMMDKIHRQIDAVVCSTPDHMHAPISLLAMHDGKHVYCQKPMAHDISEVRAMSDMAREKGVVTQMGIQIHSAIQYRMAAAYIQSGVIGKVKEVHSWSGKDWGGKPAWQQPAKDPVPGHLNWDLWVGVAPWHDYANGRYHPGNWRRWIDFGTGTQGDMACHIVDPVFKAIELGYPNSVVAEGPKPYEEMWANKGACHYVFPGTKYTVDPLPYHWYDGSNRPDTANFLLAEGQGLPGQGSMFIGEKGQMLLPHIGAPQLLPREDFLDALKNKPDIGGRNHYHDWVDACLGKQGVQATADFAYSGPLTETVLMGLVANRFPKEELKWDAKTLSFPNKPEANQYLSREYRPGYDVPGLA